MKYLLILPTLFLLSCAQKEPTVEANKRFNQYDTLCKITGGLSGEWWLYKITGSGFETTFNKSYKINFNSSNYSAIVLKPGSEEHIGWDVEYDKIHIKTKEPKIQDITFSDSTYAMEFTFDKQFIDLELKAVGGQYSYILRKELF